MPHQAEKPPIAPSPKPASRRSLEKSPRHSHAASPTTEIRPPNLERASALAGRPSVRSRGDRATGPYDDGVVNVASAIRLRRWAKALPICELFAGRRPCDEQPDAGPGAAAGRRRAAVRSSPKILSPIHRDSPPPSRGRAKAGTQKSPPPSWGRARVGASPGGATGHALRLHHPHPDLPPSRDLCKTPPALECAAVLTPSPSGDLCITPPSFPRRRESGVAEPGSSPGAQSMIDPGPRLRKGLLWERVGVRVFRATTPGLRKGLIKGEGTFAISSPISGV